MTKIIKPISSQLTADQQQQFKQYQKQLEQQQQQLVIQKQQIERLATELATLKKKRGSQWAYKLNSEQLKNFFAKIHESSKYQPCFSLKHISLSYLGSFIGIAVLAYLSISIHYLLIAVPFGATAVLLFTMPDSPLAQPRNCIVGNFLSSLSSLVMVHLFGSEPWVMALAVATAINIM